MKRALKIVGYAILLIIVSGIGFGIYKYQTDDMLRAMINQDESKLSYGPLKEIVSLEKFDFEEYELEVNDSIKIYTYLFKPSIQPIGNEFTVQEVMLPIGRHYTNHLLMKDIMYMQQIGVDMVNLLVHLIIEVFWKILKLHLKIF
ncbi:hypothetical protein [Formosa algae]|uniref:hypothetical protein n=1 Tax=Formosa algae TaxID=225843 RepID=UPI000CCE2D42|nr:hypothetical protein [Formosa algae]PNW26441.1 hypothetical protein BKP44_17090 [Formosa algae]